MLKKTAVAILGVFVIAGLTLSVVPAIRDEFQWRWVSYKNDTASYESYINSWPQGSHIAEARERFDQRGWDDALSADTVEGFERYIQLHQNGKNAAEAKTKIDSLRWMAALASNTVEGFIRYVQLHQDGTHVAEAKDKIESLHWQAASTANTIERFQQYLQLFPGGKHLAEAKDHIESLHWQEATTANTIRSYRFYIGLYPQGRFTVDAEKKIHHLQTDKSAYEAAMRIGTQASLKKFLDDYPSHLKEAEVKQALKDITEGRDIVDLLKEKKIEIATQGSGIESVQVRIRKLVPYPISVRVPAGTFFVSARQSAQNMVSTAERKISLASMDWRNLDVPAACANRPKDIPGSGDNFTVQRSPNQKDLAHLMTVLNSSNVDFATRQAAVWIVTDNASYNDLGILVTRQGFQGFGGTRTIREVETARAMKICQEAGIDITRKRIWSDRQMILRGLTGNDYLKKWLEKTKGKE